MTPSRVPDISLRLDRLSISRLLWAVVISLVFHALCFGGYELGKKYDVWQNLHLPAWIRKLTALTPSLPEQLKQPPPREVPLMFVDVNPQLAV
ncbi:MAG TPA: hypothetical protein VK327_15885, partial [Candidatus Paceibacterota bacterium]|nr:hypothetical protein [Candidatus Paceibacterota bacterium]